MGLCKCERRKVTNLFCFEHRVNVCEFCLVANHQKCVVKSYLHWLKDSDYSSQCQICLGDLENGEECIRLMCLDIFHWSCLDNYATQLPPTTAPPGYECPSCSMSIIPLTNQGGPIAEALRQKLSTAKWVIPERQRKISVKEFKAPLKPMVAESDFIFKDSKLLDTSVDTYANQFLHDQDMVAPPKALPKTLETVVPIEYSANSASRTLHHDSKEVSLEFQKQQVQKFTSPRSIFIDDEDTDKYKRHFSPSFSSGKSVLGIMKLVSFAVPRPLFRRRFLCIFGFIIFICFSLLLIMSLLASPPQIEDNFLPGRPQFRIGI